MICFTTFELMIFLENFSLKAYNTFGIHAKAKYFSAFESDPENTNKNIPEKSRFDCSWFELDNIVLSTHIGSYTSSCRIEMETQAAEEIIRFFWNIFFE